MDNNNLKKKGFNLAGYLKFFLTLSLFFLIGLVNNVHADECTDLTAPVIFVESANIVCLQNIQVSDSSGTQAYKATLQWLGAGNPGLYELIMIEFDTPSGDHAPSFIAETGLLNLPKVDIPKTYGIERYSANLVYKPQNNTDFFELIKTNVYINPDFIPNQTWKPYGMLNFNERRSVDLLGQSIPFSALADAIYNFDNTLVGIWELIEQESKDSGMQAGVYQNQETGEMVLAFRGTESCDFPCSFDESKEVLLDLAADIQLTAGKNGSQFRHAFEYAQEVVERYPDLKITLIGHSLGGGLAQAAGASLGLETFAYNSAPVADDFFDDYPAVLTSEQLSEIIHVLADIHDPVSNTDETGKIDQNASHVSSLIQFDFDEKEIMPDRLAELDALRVNKHSMSKFIENASELMTIYAEGW